MNRRAVAALGLLAAACSVDPQETLRGADLHIVVRGLDRDAARLRVELAGSDDLVVSRAPSTGGLSQLDVYFLDLPAGRYRLTARTLDASETAIGCAEYASELDTAAAPLDVTLDMVADACRDGAPDAAPDAEGPPDAGPGGPPDAKHGRPDADDKDRRMVPPGHDDARVNERRDARTGGEEDDDEQN